MIIIIIQQKHPKRKLDFIIKIITIKKNIKNL